MIAEKIAVLLSGGWTNYRDPRQHATYLLWAIRKGHLAEIMEDLGPNGVGARIWRAWKEANELLPIADHDQDWLAAVWQEIGEALPNYPVANYQMLAAIGRQDLMGSYDTDERGHLVAVHPIYNGRYLIVETAGYWSRRGYADKMAFWPGSRREDCGPFSTFEAALAHELSPSFGNAIIALLRGNQ